MPAENNCLAAKLIAPIVDSLRNTEILSAGKALATIRSGLPSPLKSAMLTAIGALAVVAVIAAAKLGAVPGVVVVLRYTDTTFTPAFTVAISKKPSPSTSPTETEEIAVPVEVNIEMGAPKVATSVVDAI